MLSETERGNLIEDLKSDRLDFTYGTYTPTIKIYRYGEGFKKKTPYVMVNFLPANRSKFRSVGNIIGKDVGDHVEYGYCQLEYVAITCYCDEFHNHKTVIGRLLSENTLQVIRKHILSNWDHILRGYGACIDKIEDFNITYVGDFQSTQATKIVVYELDFYLRTQFRWRMTPDDYEPSIVEKSGVYIKEDKEKEYTYELVGE